MDNKKSSEYVYASGDEVGKDRYVVGFTNCRECAVYGIRGDFIRAGGYNPETGEADDIVCVYPADDVELLKKKATDDLCMKGRITIFKLVPVSSFSFGAIHW